jgi:predicted nucleotidyltransferase
VINETDVQEWLAYAEADWQAMVFDQAQRNEQIQKFINHLQRYIAVQEAILFGSHAYGEPHEWSDIDLVIISPNFAEQSLIDRLQFLYWATWEAGTIWIEPLGYTSEEFESASSLSLLGEVRERGIVVYEKDGKST